MNTPAKRPIILTSKRTLYRYLVKKRLGSGGFGDVYAAEVEELGITVAIKRIKMLKGGTADAVVQWERESSTHDSLSHPNVLQVLDAFVANGSLFLATELATASIDHCTPPSGWDEAEVIAAGVQIASALHYMHTAYSSTGPLIHRDVTPNNVFYFQDSSRFKLGDFGISKQLATPSDVAVTQVANWAYVAPELARGGFSVPQSDLFQLGLVLYYMAVGSSAIDPNLSIGEKRKAISAGAAHAAAKDAVFLSDELQAIVMKLLFRDRKKRYSSAESVVADLRAARTG